jgi:hypothetical protein
MIRPAVSFGDIMRAQAALKPRGIAIDRLVEICGLVLSPNLEGLHAVPDPDEFDNLDDESETWDFGEADELDLGGADELPPGVRRLQPVRQGQPPTTAVSDPLEGAAREPVGSHRHFEGLLAERDAADLVCSAASLPTATDRVDVERAALDLARAMPILSLPRIHVPSLVLGVQILVDVGEAMQPFREDQEDVLRRFHANLREQLHIRYYSDDPTRGCGRQRRRTGWITWSPPRIGTPLVVLSDLGCGFPRRPRATEAWIKLADRLRRRRSRLVVFAPVRRGRLPLQLLQAIEIVIWDRSTGRRSVARLRRALDA